MPEEPVIPLTQHHPHTSLSLANTLPEGVKPAPRCKGARHRVRPPAPYTRIPMTCFASSSLALRSHCLAPHRSTQKKNWLILSSQPRCRTDGLLISNHELNSHLALQRCSLKKITNSQNCVASWWYPKTIYLGRRASSLNTVDMNRKGKLSGVSYDWLPAPGNSPYTIRLAQSSAL